MGQDLTTALRDYLQLRWERDGWTVETFAAKSGLSPSTVGRAKNGDVTIGLDKLAGISKALGMQTWELVKEIERPTGKPKELPDEGLYASDPNTVKKLSPAHKHFLLTVRTILGQVPERAIAAIDEMMWSHIPKIPDDETKPVKAGKHR